MLLCLLMFEHLAHNPEVPFSNVKASDLPLTPDGNYYHITALGEVRSNMVKNFTSKLTLSKQEESKFIPLLCCSCIGQLVLVSADLRF